MSSAILIICHECGCKRVLEEGEIPKGNCDFCLQDFGWTIFPKGINKNFKLNDGDSVMINTALNRVHPDRIMSIVDAKGKLRYKKGIRFNV